MQKSINRNSEFVLAIDIGTSGCRATLFNNQRAVISSAEQFYTYTYSSSNGYAEQNIEQVLQAIITVANKTAAGFSSVISHVILDSMLHSLVLADEAGNPLTPLSIWADTRSTGQCVYLRGVHSRHQWHQSTGCPVSPTYPLSRLLWYKDSQPALFSRFAKALSIKAYILYRIFGLWLEDHTLASATGLFNLKTRTWDDEILRYVGISAERLPELVPIEYQIPAIYTSFGRSAGLPRNATWVIGGGDGPMAHLGTAGYQPDYISMTIGTSSAVRMLASGKDAGKSDDMWTYVLDKGHFISGKSSNNGGNVLDWYLHNVLKMGIDWQTFDARLTKSRFDQELFFFPYLFNERIVASGCALSSGFLGARANHTTNDLIRSIIEGIIFHVALMFEQLVGNSQICAIALSGSLTKPSFVQDVIAELLHFPVLSVPEHHAPQLGSFMMFSGQMAGSRKEVKTVKKISGYCEKYAAWKNLMASLTRRCSLPGM